MRRRTFLQTLVGGMAAMATSNNLGGVSANHASRGAFLLSDCGCGRATAYPEANKVVTLGGRTHAAWLDSVETGFKVRIRTLDRASGAWSPIYTVADAHDNHGGPALTCDSRGFLHIAYYPHQHPMRYRRSTRPNDASEWEDEVQFGARCTYPTLVCVPDDTLILACRESVENPWVVNLYRKSPGQDWQGPHTVLCAGHTGYAQFQQALAWSPDRRTLHLSCRFYDGSPGRGHTVGYICSPDLGTSWQARTGEQVKLPATADTVSIIAQARDREGYGFQCGSIAVDSRGAPVVLYSEHDQLPAQASIACRDESGAWRRQPLLPALPREYADSGWGLSMPGGVTVGADGRMFVALALTKPADADDKSAWAHRLSGIVAFESRDHGATLTARVAAEPASGAPRWLPSLERPTGHNRVEFPGLIYTEGPSGSSGGAVLSNKVWFTDLR